MTDSFIFYAEYLEAIQLIKSKQERLKLCYAIVKYAFDNIIPTNLTKRARVIFNLIKLRLDNGE